ncbi:hypothetical protein F975_01779 [Acinetobacter sp. ANC 3789]|uniref:hypothetical protein n=1 Tax=Acinetobacter sp. ANC 3789 TaxID=1217714 RepID=UPI0002D0B8A6|nr:hypothetical protein [Acinetobacter sp. ANC 3789]ENU80027.1 hypothetical protein F975_01779 [Acinetobacter sp. ANC 3789]
MKQLDIQVDQIHPDMALIVVRADFNKLGSIEAVRELGSQIQQAFQVTGKPVAFMHDGMTIEQLTVEQLERLGFQSIDRGTS